MEYNIIMLNISTINHLVEQLNSPKSLPISSYFTFLWRYHGPYTILYQ